MVRVICVEKSQIFDKAELKLIVEKCVKLDLNLIVFGLPRSGKSSLVRAICAKSGWFVTFEEEEAMEEKHSLELKRDLKGKKWVVGHQFPSMDESVPDAYLKDFLDKMGLNPQKWVIIRIKTK